MTMTYSPDAVSQADVGTADLTMICRQVRRVSHDVSTFVFEAPHTAHLEFEAGQFLTWFFDIEGEEHSRCYTISSPPTRGRRVSITVKRVTGGVVSNWLHDVMAPGMRVRAIGPGGSFCLDAAPTKRLFLGGGSGITPFMSMLRGLHDLAADDDIVFIQSARTPLDVLFTEELTTIARDLPNVRVVHLCDDEAPGMPWHGIVGRLTTEQLLALVPDVAERLVYCCGPQPYMTSMHRSALDLGVPEHAYFEESFSLPDLNPALSTDAGGATPSSTFAVEFRKAGKHIECAPDKPLLQAAFEAGITLPSSCMQGICGTCKASVLSGDVDMQHAGGIRPREVQNNKILLCCSTPKSDLVIDA